MDLLHRAPIRALTRWQTRRALQLAALIAAAIVVAHGILGPQVAERNLATVVTWVLSRGLLLVALLAVGNLFCAACPMMLVRDVARRVVRPRWHWPRALRRKWPAVALLGLGLFAYERFDLWSLPLITAVLILGYFAAALVVDLLFTGASFCKYVCPIGQFNFITSTVSPLTLQARDLDTCRACRTVDCIKGRIGNGAGAEATRDMVREPAPIAARGCELALFMPSKIGNLDCTFCFDCVRACPHDNIGLVTRTPGEELSIDDRRSGIGRLAARPDLAALAILFAFGAILNAFAMTGTAGHLQHQMIAAGVPGESTALALLFVASLLVAPLAVGAGAAIAGRLAGGRTPGTDIRRYVFALVPLGAGIWLAHYGFHLLTGALTVVPVTQSALIDVFGHPLAGAPLWNLTGAPSGILFPLQVGCVLLGALGSAGVAMLTATRQGHSVATTLPCTLLIAGLTCVAIWTLAQPMDMRGMVMPG